ncbi:NUDIX domain-containing protein [Novosphingobium sp. 1949]|uniref:NUDIX domain-containing protein n=1 Tax=Novosphingobium organovorum TaxID=2930092 RepID=A0ABT0BDX1_9SPHN|nr:NUDIX domain-containing protein [Novosphingobium organovorum]MCJ2183105.1 NUDIX domain-containing protein [Novosphingobium organovorum]
MLLLKRLVFALPAPLHRGLFRVAHAARKALWKWRKPRVEGVRVLACDAQGRIILVRHSYGSDAWMPSGGGLSRGEDPLVAAARELREETGCRLCGARLVAVTAEDLHGASNVVYIVAGTTRDTPVPDGREIVAAKAFALDVLPTPMPKGLAAKIALWLDERPLVD